MKTYLALISAAVVGLAACSQEPAAEAKSAASAASEVAAPAAADNCAATVESNDQMQFNTKDIQVSKSCKEFTITLKHTGTQPKEGMGHNIVISKDSDQEGVLTDGADAGAAADYVKANDARVIAHTKLIGGGEEASLTLDPTKLADGNYKFFCSFPGHVALMSGTVTLVD